MATKTKTVTRKYYSKKEGKYVTKTYTYSHKSTKGKVLVSKTGKVKTKNVEAMRAAIKGNPAYTDAEKRAALNDLEILVKIRSKNKERLTTTGFTGWRQDNETDRFFANAGYSVEEFAAELGIDPDEVRDRDNWVDGKFKLGDKEVSFNFTYTGNFWEVN